MAINQEVLDAIESAKEYYSELNYQYLQAAKKGARCLQRDPIYIRLGLLLRAIGYKIEAGTFDEIAVILYQLIMLILGGYQPLKKLVRWGIYSTKPNSNTITFQYTKSYPSSAREFDLIFPTDVLASNKFIAFELPGITSIPTKWVNDYALNHGNFPDSAFQAPEPFSSKVIVISRKPFVFTNNTLTLKIFI